MRALESKVGKQQAGRHESERILQQSMTYEEALAMFERRNHGLQSNPPANVYSRIKRQEQEIRRNELAVEAIKKQIPMLAVESAEHKNILICPACKELVTDTDAVYVYEDAPTWCPACGQAIKYK